MRAKRDKRDMVCNEMSQGGCSCPPSSTGNHMIPHHIPLRNSPAHLHLQIFQEGVSTALSIHDMCVQHIVMATLCTPSQGAYSHGNTVHHPKVQVVMATLCVHHSRCTRL